MLRARPSRAMPALPRVIVDAAGIGVVPEPDIVPPFQLKAVVTLIDCEPVRVPLKVTFATVTGTSRVTAWLTVAVSPAPGTPEPPHVEALLQLPLWLLVKVEARSGAADAARTRKHHQKRSTRRVVMSLPHDRNGPLTEIVKERFYTE